MKITINHALFNATTFDSGALGTLTSVVHAFTKPGTYHVHIAKGGTAVNSIQFEVSSDTEDMQLTLDLSPAISPKASLDCHCGGQTDKIVAVPKVSPKGMVLFHASTGTGYSATVKDATGTVVFDSQQLSKGDLFALSLFEPTTYTMKNTLGKATGEIDVTFTEKDKKRLSSLDTQYVETLADSFKPNKLSVTSTQGIVFQIMESARIVVQRKEKRAEPLKSPKNQHRILIRK